MKKIPLLYFGLVLLGLAALGLGYAQFWRLPFINVDPIEAVPNRSPVILQFDVQTFFGADSAHVVQIKLPSETMYEGLVEKPILQLVGDLPKIMGEDALIQMQPKRILAAMSPNARGIDFSFIVEKGGQAVDLQTLLDGLSTVHVETATFKGHTIYRIQKAGESLTLAEFRNLYLIGVEDYLVEDALEQLFQYRTSLLYLDRVGSLPETKYPQVSIPLDNISLLCSPFLNAAHRELEGPLDQLGQWVHLECIPTESDGIKLQGGYQSLDDPMMLRLQDQKEIDFSPLQDYLPDHLAVGVAFSSYAEQWPDQDNYFDQYIRQWLGQRAVYLITEPHSPQLTNEKFVLLEMGNPEMGKVQLKNLENELGAPQHFDYQGFRVIQVNVQHLMEPLLGSFLADFDFPYLTQVNQYVLLAKSRQAIEIYLDKYVASQMMAQEPHWVSMQSELNFSGQMLLVGNNAHIQKLLNRVLKPTLQNQFDELIQPWDQAQLAAVTLKNVDGEQWALEGFAQKKLRISNRISTNWKVKLTKEAVIPPAPLYNKKTQSYEIAVQDKTDQLYFYDAKGSLLWKRKLDGPILSEFHQIDYYGNEEYQLLFNTAKQVYLVDRNGRDVSAYPIRLRSSAVNGLSVTDFGIPKNYSFFVACKNGNLYGFDQTGRPIPGWNPRERVGKVKHPIMHLPYNGKDYLIALTKNGRLHAFTKDGRRHFNPVKVGSSFNSGPAPRIKLADKQLILADYKGRTKVVNLDGSFKTLPTAFGDTRDAQMVYHNFVGDKEKEVAILKKKKLAFFSLDDAKVAELQTYQFAERPTDMFTVGFPGEAQKYIGILDDETNEIFMINGQGELHQGFPLAGSTPFQLVDLHGDGTRMLLVALEDSVVAYRL